MEKLIFTYSLQKLLASPLFTRCGSGQRFLSQDHRQTLTTRYVALLQRLLVTYGYATRIGSVTKLNIFSAIISWILGPSFSVVTAAEGINWCTKSRFCKNYVYKGKIRLFLFRLSTSGQLLWKPRPTPLRSTCWDLNLKVLLLMKWTTIFIRRFEVRSELNLLSLS